MADAEAIGRLISLTLRIPSDYSPKEVAQQVINQLSGIGGSRQQGFGVNRIHSLGDAVSKVLAEYLGSESTYPEITENGNGRVKVNGNGRDVSETTEKEIKKTPEVIDQPRQSVQEIESKRLETRSHDFCPKCGTASFVYEEGCRKCYSCGHSEC